MMDSISEKYGDWVIPLILIILIGGLLAIKVFNMYWVPLVGPMLCSGSISRALILTNPTDYNSASTFAKEMQSRVPGLTTVLDDDVVTHVRKGYITSNNYDLVVLYGDHTKLTPAARSEIASFINDGGNLLIFKGAGLKDENDPYVFNWGVEDLSSYISFSPDCGDIDMCNDVSAITITGSEIGKKITFVPVQWENPIIKRIGIQAPLDMDVPSSFTATRVQDLGNNKIAYLEWRDTNNKPHSIPAIITYTTGMSSRVLYLAYNPLDLKQEALFRNAIMWVIGKI